MILLQLKVLKRSSHSHFERYLASAVRYHFLFFLALISRAEATDSDLTGSFIENQIAQSSQGYPSNPNPYLRALREIYSLQQQNSELKDQIIILQFHCRQAEILQQRVGDLEQALSAVNNQNQDLHAQIGALTTEQAEYGSKLQQCDKLFKQFGEQEQELQKRIQQLQVSIENYKQQLQDAQKKIAKVPQEVVWLNEQIQSKNKEIRELSTQIGELNKQNYGLSLDKKVSAQQLQDRAKRLDIVEKAHLQSLKERKEKETDLQSTIDEKNATIGKWQQEYDLLKSQLDKANALNSKLSQQITQLEEECKKR